MSMSGTRGCEAYLEWIYQNWYQNHGPCRDCPIRDPEAVPYYGDGTYPADIFLLGQAPFGGRNEPRDADVSGDETDAPTSYRERMAARKPMYHWLFGHPDDVNRARVPAWFWHELDAGFTQSVDHPVYFSNLLKCAPTDQELVNDVARECCTGYLPEELRRVDPDVVIPFGNAAIQWVYTHNGLGDSRGSTHEVGRVQETDDYAIVPAVHWSYLHTQLPKVARNSPLDLTADADFRDYWQALARVIKDVMRD